MYRCQMDPDPTQRATVCGILPMTGFVESTRDRRHVNCPSCLALPEPEYPEPKERPVERCPLCDDTGDVHSMDGEWQGVCWCPAGMDLGGQ